LVALGLISVAIAVVLLLVEAHMSTGGLIGALAVCALVGGVALLLTGAAAGLLAVLAVSGGVCVAAVGGLVMLVRRLRPARHLRPRTGVQAMVGHLGVIRAEGSAARVFVDGALWRIEPSPLVGETTLQDGDRVVIEYVNGLTLHVRKAEELELNR
jgi:membrane protein implicated in regulation of membrane protease activity